MYHDFTFEESTLMSIYTDGTREGTLRALREMRGYLEADETDLQELTNSSIEKLEKLSDEDFQKLDLFFEFDGTEDEDAV